MSGVKSEGGGCVVGAGRGLVWLLVRAGTDRRYDWLGKEAPWWGRSCAASAAGGDGSGESAASEGRADAAWVSHRAPCTASLGTATTASCPAPPQSLRLSWAPPSVIRGPASESLGSASRTWTPGLFCQPGPPPLPRGPDPLGPGALGIPGLVLFLSLPPFP